MDVTHAKPPRLGSDDPFPPYTFFSPQWPHPRRHPDGHSFGAPEPVVAALEPSRWVDSAAYLRGVDLFNHGYYWEAHEQWEALWHVAGCEGPVAEMLKALIKLTAAGVKVRQGRKRGIRVHAGRAREHVEAVRAAVGGDEFLGLRYADLLALADDVAARCDESRADSETPAVVVFAGFLLPGGAATAASTAEEGVGTGANDTGASESERQERPS